MPLAEFQDDDEIDLLGLLDVLLDARWLIAGVAALVLLLGGAYAFLSQPVYEANALIQVEDSKPGLSGAAGALGEASSLFQIQSPATAEMEILRSRLVVGKSVDDLQLYVTATPHYLPLVGNWLARHATELSNPGFLGIGGYVSGNESIRLGLLEVPSALEGKPLLLVATEGGFELRGPNGQTLAQGKPGHASQLWQRPESRPHSGDRTQSQARRLFRCDALLPPGRDREVAKGTFHCRTRPPVRRDCLDTARH